MINNILHRNRIKDLQFLENFSLIIIFTPLLQSWMMASTLYNPVASITVTFFFFFFSVGVTHVRSNFEN